MPGNKSPTAPKWWTLSARTSSKWPTAATTAVVTHHLHPPRTVPTAHNSTQLAEQTAQHVIPIVPNVTRQDTGHHGGQATPTKECTSTWVTAEEVQMPTLNHNHCHGWDNKTDAIDVGKDHSPQDEIALHYIQPYATVRNTHPTEIMVGDICAPQCNEAYTTIQLPASASRKGTSSLHVKVDTGAGGNVLPLCVFPHIPLYGALCGPITWQPDHPGT